MADPTVWASDPDQQPGESHADYTARRHPDPEPRSGTWDWNERRIRRQPPPPPTHPPRDRPPPAYAATALDEEVTKVAASKEGTRETTLNNSAFSLGQLVGAGVLDRGLVEDRLRAAALPTGLPPAEIEAKLRRSIDDGIRNPRDIPPLTVVDQVSEVDASEIGGGQPPDAPAVLHERLVQHELRSLRARRDARQLLEHELRGPPEPFDAGTLAEVLARPAAPVNRVEGLIPWEAGTLLTAQRKTGKTTTVLNLARSLLTGQDFLGRFGVRPVMGEVALLNFEVTGAQLARWAVEVGVDLQRLFLVNFRGRPNPLSSEEDRGRLAALLRSRGVETVVCDPFGRAYTGTSQNDPGEVGAFLSTLDLFARTEVGALDLVLTAHAGWNGERTRGSSALEDWADSIITLTRDDSDDGQGERYLRAIGRDVDVDEDRLHFDQDTRTLTLAGTGSRAAARVGRRSEDLDRAVLSVIIAQPGVNGVGLGVALRDAGVSFQKGDERKAANRLVDVGSVVVKYGPRGAHCYHQTPPTPTYPDIPQGGTS